MKGGECPARRDRILFVLEDIYENEWKEDVPAVPARLGWGEDVIRPRRES